ncbi:aldehyde dehydrogenase family protein [Rugosimonospora africana]|uniref:Gamma-glutamyl-phosphate reductase n=1 Tax=Rugosimonospora africana TaxID=556532 RepID=A0A8J3QLV0_9ACTN|nr:aldehyde dehydrogenase family protein [Rugosimonospora africana]GIH12976.1 gamma-glutamyl-phosphate reductase [Rugosimonospora africana]
MTETHGAVADAARRAHQAASSLAAASDETIGLALRGMVTRLSKAPEALLAANRADLEAAAEAKLSVGLTDRLRLGADRLAGMADQLTALADLAPEPSRVTVRELPGGLLLQEWSRPVGVIGANFEARPNVVVDIASQLIKSRNAGVLRTGSAALRSAAALMDEVVGPALAEAGLDPDAIQLVRVPGRESAAALVSQPGLIPLVILRGSGDSTRELAQRAALNGVKTLAHADGGGVMYLHPSADRRRAEDLIVASVDRLGVCNRLNLLLVDRAIWEQSTPWIVDLLAAQQPSIRAMLPPHDFPIGHEWALDSAADATVTIAPADGPVDAARIANEETSGLAAAIVAEDSAAAGEFLGSYAGTGGFWNATTRLLDGFKLLAVPETGINIDRVPGPRGPVTFRDLRLRQYVVTPAARAADLD